MGRRPCRGVDDWRLRGATDRPPRLAVAVLREKSCGIVPFREVDGEILYLVISSAVTKREHWEFPKGGVEEGEREIETALRELWEETGVEDVRVLPGYREPIRYIYRRPEGLVSKQVVYFIARVADPRVKLREEEAKDYRWADYDEARKLLRHANARALLERCHAFITGKPIPERQRQQQPPQVGDAAEAEPQRRRGGKRRRRAGEGAAAGGRQIATDAGQGGGVAAGTRQQPAQAAAGESAQARGRPGQQAQRGQPAPRKAGPPQRQQAPAQRQSQEARHSQAPAQRESQAPAQRETQEARQQAGVADAARAPAGPQQTRQAALAETTAASGATPGAQEQRGQRRRRRRRRRGGRRQAPAQGEAGSPAASNKDPA